MNGFIKYTHYYRDYYSIYHPLCRQTVSRVLWKITCHLIGLKSIALYFLPSIPALISALRGCEQAQVSHWEKIVYIVIDTYMSYIMWWCLSQFVWDLYYVKKVLWFRNSCKNTAGDHWTHTRLSSHSHTLTPPFTPLTSWCLNVWVLGLPGQWPRCRPASRKSGGHNTYLRLHCGDVDTEAELTRSCCLWCGSPRWTHHGRKLTKPQIHRSIVPSRPGVFFSPPGSFCLSCCTIPASLTLVQSKELKEIVFRDKMHQYFNILHNISQRYICTSPRLYVRVSDYCDCLAKILCKISSWCFQAIKSLYTYN